MSEFVREMTREELVAHGNKLRAENEKLKAELQEARLDAALVVRCKDCRFFQHGTTCARFGIRMSRAHDDYCSYGRRKEDAEQIQSGTD